MGLYIKGMEMPKSCEECILDHKFFKWLGCNRHVSGDTIAEGKRSPACPLVPVPEPHGRLIDANEMFVEFAIEGQRSKRYKLGEKWELNCEEIRSVISRLPTIIPASEECEK